jgi:hypothetical protein
MHAQEKTYSRHIYFTNAEIQGFCSGKITHVLLNRILYTCTETKDLLQYEHSKKGISSK